MLTNLLGANGTRAFPEFNIGNVSACVHVLFMLEVLVVFYYYVA